MIEIGNTAILRSTGLAASTSTTANQEAKDFKVVIAIDNPPDDIRPGLVLHRQDHHGYATQALTIPIQALTVRQRGDLEPATPAKTESRLRPKWIQPPRRPRRKSCKAYSSFETAQRAIRTGRSRESPVPRTSKLLKRAERRRQIITGPYKVIRTLRNDAKIKVDNKLPVVGSGQLAGHGDDRNTGARRARRDPKARRHRHPHVTISGRRT